MLEISVIMLFIWILLFGILFTTPVHITKKGILAFWYFFVIALAIFSFYAEPSVSDDLYRHYALIDMLRSGADLKYTYGEYLFVFRIFLKLVSMTPYNGFLPFITVMIWGVMIGEVIRKYITRNGCYKYSVLLCFLVIIGGCPTFYLISGIRTALALAICAYAYYCFFLEKKWLVYFVLVVGSATLHYVSILFAGLQLLYGFVKNKNSTKAYISVLGALIIISTAMNTNIVVDILARSRILYFIRLREKWISYSVSSSFSESMLIEYGLKVGMLVLLAVSVFIIMDRHNQDKDSSIGLLLFLILSIIAASRMEIIFIRIPYIIAMLSLPTLDICLKSMGRESRSVYVIGSALFYAFQALYMFYAMLNFIEFGGVNVQNLIHGSF
ncbi:MAG: hypothetical protein HFG82_04845 [Dorea sp.]|jgi:hypothetical protein|nr:hypothetical protein [Dorea sp.]